MSLTPSPLMRELVVSQNLGFKKTLAKSLQESCIRLLLQSLNDQCFPRQKTLKPLEHYLRSGLDRRITRMIHTLVESKEPLGVKELAKSVSISERQLHRLSIKFLGMTPVQAIHQSLVEKATARLRRSDDNISEIAFDIGFASLSQFNAMFKDIVGCTPSMFRKLRR
jgi:AraC-like DNA-binding protein